MESLLVSSLGNVKDVDFVTEPEERYKCVHCHQVLKSPLQTRCGHRICDPCLKSLLQHSPGGVTCPGGEDTCEVLNQGQVYPDLGVLRELKRLLVYCPYKSYGCQETLAWSQLEDHSKSCRFETTDCPNKPDGCQEVVLKLDLQKHCAKCDYRTIQCPECSQPVIFYCLKTHLQDHCPNIIIQCNQCGQSLQRSLGEEHMQTCPSRPVECQYKIYGCPFTGLKSAVEQHEQQSASQHLEMTVRHVFQLDLKCTKIADKHEEALGLIVRLEADLKTCRHEIEDLKKSQQALETTCMDNKKTAEAFNRQMISLMQKLATLAPKQDLDRQQSVIASLQQDVNNLKSHQPNRSTGAASRREASRGQDNTQLEKQLIQLSIQTAELEMRCKYLESTSFNGVLIWKITDFHRRKREAKNGTNRGIYSPHFYSSKCGYKVCARIYLNGDGQGTGTHVSLFFVVLGGEYDAILPWPFRHKVVLTLLNQTSGQHHTDFFRPDTSSSSFQRPSSDMNVASGCPMFVSQRTLESSQFLVDDSVFIKVEIEDCKV